MKRLLLALIFCLVATAASAQCNGVFSPGSSCGNPGTSNGPPRQMFGSGPIFNPLSFGAKCDGSTDDHVAFQNAINAAQSTGGSVRWVGNCAISTSLSITSAIDFGGVGVYVTPGVPVGSGNSISMLLSTGSITAINISTDSAVYLHDFRLLNNATTGTGILLTSSNTLNQGSLFRYVLLNGFAIGIDTGNAASFTFDKLWITSCGTYAIRVQNTFNPDAGDSVIINSTLGCGASATAAIEQLSSGGLRVINNKMNNPGTWGYELNLANGASTGDLFIIGNSIENEGAAAIHLVRQGTTGATAWQNVMITSNELYSGSGSGSAACVLALDTHGNWLNNVTITGNTCVLSDTVGQASVAFNIASGIQGLVMGNNVTKASTANASSQNISLGASNADCVIGPNLHWLATLAASTLGPCTGSSTTISPN